jgi:hypothetical protein
MYRDDQGVLKPPVINEGEMLDMYQTELKNWYETEKAAFNGLITLAFDEKLDLVLCKVEVEGVKDVPLYITGDSDPLLIVEDEAIAYIDYMQEVIWVSDSNPVSDNQLIQCAKDMGEEISFVGEWQEYTLHGDRGHIRRITRD